MRRRQKQAEETSKKREETGSLRGGKQAEQNKQGRRSRSRSRRKNTRQWREIRRNWRRNTGGRATKRSRKTTTGRTITRGSRVITRTIGTLAGGQGLRRALTTVVTLSTDIAANRKLAERSVVTKILATEALRDGILGFRSFKCHPKVEEASNSTKRRQKILVVSKTQRGRRRLERTPAPSTSVRHIWRMAEIGRSLEVSS